MKKIITMAKIINPFSIKIGEKFYPVFCKIEIKENKYNKKEKDLSISGVISPLKSGNARGSCGQIYDKLIGNDEKRFEKDWNKYLVAKFVLIWQEWHLNDIQAGCEHQRQKNWGEKEVMFKGEKKNTGWLDEKEHPAGVLNKPCPICAYKYGTAWKRKELPHEVISFLKYDLPESKKTPAWI